MALSRLRMPRLDGSLCGLSLETGAKIAAFYQMIGIGGLMILASIYATGRLLSGEDPPSHMRREFDFQSGIHFMRTATIPSKTYQEDMRQNSFDDAETSANEQEPGRKGQKSEPQHNHGGSRNHPSGMSEAVIAFFMNVLVSSAALLHGVRKKEAKWMEPFLWTEGVLIALLLLKVTSGVYLRIHGVKLITFYIHLAITCLAMYMYALVYNLYRDYKEKFGGTVVT